VKRLVIVITLAILLVALGLLVSRDTGISVADTSIPDNEVTSDIRKGKQCFGKCYNNNYDVCCGS
jgi:hypothetical protein